MGAFLAWAHVRKSPDCSSVAVVVIVDTGEVGDEDSLLVWGRMCCRASVSQGIAGLPAPL